ncbi:DUF4412 domain-containing protein [Roseivirga sp.]|uniref:DUF4412 domain-containing protein n=1 Tax=Roseivirga sp. TaxID=1964215 RepID=UPI003B52CB2C
MLIKNMRSIFLLCFFAMTAQLSVAQESFKITFDFAIDAEGDEAEMAMMMMQDSKMVLAFKGDKARVHMDMGMMTTTVISHDDSKSGLMLMDMMGMKMAVAMTEADYKKALENQKDPKIEETGETKTIAGYKCKKAIVTDEDGTKMTIYYTPDLKPLNKNTEYTYKGIEGMPLEMHTVQEGMTITITATEVVKNNVSDDEFNLDIPEGYKKMTMQELEQMGGGY